MLRRSSLILVVLAALLVVSLASVAAQDETLRISLVVNGVLGDKSFFDSAQRGMDMVMDEYDAEVNTIELGIDPQNWETGLADAMSDVDNYDILIAGTFQMIDYMAKNADKYPDKTFIFFDAPMPYDNAEICKDGCKNVYSITYKQNEGSFLAGVYAAAMSAVAGDGKPEVVLGAVGGQDIPVINDFIVGYEQGACLVSADSNVLVQYAGSWNDPAKGKEIALAMYDQGADVIFQVAGGTGVGVFEAAQEKSLFAIGVDSDQASIIQETDPEQAARILTSMQKNVDASLFRAIGLYLDEELPLGTVEGLGLDTNGVSLSINDIYNAATPQGVQDLVAAATEAVIAGDVSVVTVFADEASAAKVGQGCAAMPAVEFDAASFLSQ